MNKEYLKIINEIAEILPETQNKNLKKINKFAQQISTILSNCNKSVLLYKTLFNAFSNCFDIDAICNFSKNIRNNLYRLLENGIYPYSIIDVPDDGEISTKDLVDYALKDIENKIQDMDIFFPIFDNYKLIIVEIFELYYDKNYRLCILSLINFISQVYNSNFDNKDFKECNEDILRNKEIMNDDNVNFYEFIPFLLNPEDENRSVKKYFNSIEKSYKNHPEKYLNVPYNRNAIIHGYSKNFGTKENCLRWFSVMLNLLDLCTFINVLINGGVESEIKI